MSPKNLYNIITHKIIIIFMTATLVVIHSKHFFVSWLLKLELPKERLSAVHSTVSLRKNKSSKASAIRYPLRVIFYLKVFFMRISWTAWCFVTRLITVVTNNVCFLVGWFIFHRELKPRTEETENLWWDINFIYFLG